MLFGIKSALIKKRICYQVCLKWRIFKDQNKISWWWSYTFLWEKILKVDSNHTCLAVISLDSALKKDNNYCPQVFLKECKYVEKKSD